MARALNKLTSRGAASLTAPGRHSDGGGLYLVVDSSGARRWLFMYRWAGKQKEMGLGGFDSVPLARAREMAQAAREALAQGTSPLEIKRAEEERPTFGVFADGVVESLSGQWRNPKHIAQWKMTLTDYAKPIRDVRVDEVTTDHVLKVLKPVWAAKPETASRLRGRIERVLDAAKAKGLRSGENPARWKGHLDHLLPKRKILSRGHHKALPVAALPGFMADLRWRAGISARALEFLILTAARTSEVREARWSEIDLEVKVWTVPAERMKASREHRVPLSPSAVALLEKLGRKGEVIFAGSKDGSFLSTGSLERVLVRMKVAVTVHGFRSTFRDWVGEETEYASDLAEAALAHIVGDATERAYRRGDALERRRKLMDVWAEFCDRCRTTPPANVARLAANGGVADALPGASGA